MHNIIKDQKATKNAFSSYAQSCLRHASRDYFKKLFAIILIPLCWTKMNCMTLAPALIFIYRPLYESKIVLHFYKSSMN